MSKCFNVGLKIINHHMRFGDFQFIRAINSKFELQKYLIYFYYIYIVFTHNLLHIIILCHSHVTHISKIMSNIHKKYLIKSPSIIQ